MDFKKYNKYLTFIDKYKKVSNASTGSEVDSNANVENKNVTTLMGELFKKDAIGINRLIMTDYLEKLFGKDVADEYIRQLDSHEIYSHDETKPVYSYCCSITMYPFLFNGLKTIGGISEAPKNLQSFCGSFINLVFAVASQFAGAVSTPEFLAYLDYFIRREYGDDYYLHTDMVVEAGKKNPRTLDGFIDGLFQQVVYSINQPAAARDFQSVFWNTAYFDEAYFKGMFENFVFPDGTSMKWESVSWLQKKFMTWFNEERRKKILTFPVETMNLLNDGKEYVDKEWADFTAEMYAKGHSFFTYTSNSVDSLASCCFDKDQEFMTEHGYRSFAELGDGAKVRVPSHDGRSHDAVVHTYGEQDLYEISFRCKDKVQKVFATRNHTWILRDGSRTNHLEVGDVLLTFPNSNREWVVEDIQDTHRHETVWCLEVEDTHSFVLKGLIVTGNCRLRNEIQDNTFSYTLGAGGVSTGSKKVITTNINRLVQNVKRANPNATLDDISEAVREQAKKVHKYLLAYNAWLKDLYDAGLMTIYNAGYISLEKQFLTLGVNGFAEGAEFLGIKISPNDKYFEYVDAILRPIYEENRAARTKDAMFNTEFVPKMCGNKVA